MTAVKSVWFNTGDEDAFALVVGENDDGTLNLVYFPTTSPVEHADNIPEGEGGRTWHN
jgi:hypothetical protein